MKTRRSSMHLVFVLTFLLSACLNGAEAKWYPYTVVEQGPEDVSVVAGETARFSCDLNYAAKRDTIWWLYEQSECFLYISRNNELRRTCGINMHHYNIHIDNIYHIYTIEIDNISEDDAGTYICKNETNMLAQAELVVLPRPTSPTSVTPTGDECKENVCCEVSFYPTGIAPAFEMEAQASCTWPKIYSNVDIHVHLFCDDQEIRGANKVLLADRAIGKLEPGPESGCANFTCNLEIVGESGIQETCTVRSERESKENVLKVEPEINYVEEGFNAVFFCHIKNARPTSGSFRWYIVQTHYTSTNTISSNPISSTDGLYGKLELSSVRLDDDFLTVQCIFEPDVDGTYATTQSNPALLRVLRRSTTRISCYTSPQSSLLECKDKGDTGDGSKTGDGTTIWPQSVKEWVLIVTIVVLLIVVLSMLCRPMLRKSPHDPRASDPRNRHYQVNGNEGVIENHDDVTNLPAGYEYLAERHYDAPYKLLRNIRNFPRLFRNHVMHRHHGHGARGTRQGRHEYATTDDAPRISTYGTLDPNASHQEVRMHDRRVSRPSEITDLESSDYDVLDASTVNDLGELPPSSPTQLLAALVPTSSPISESDYMSVPIPQRPKSSIVSGSPQMTEGRPSIKKKPKVTPKPSVMRRPARIPSISADIHCSDEEGRKWEPRYMNTAEVLGDDDAASISSSPIEKSPKPT